VDGPFSGQLSDDRVYGFICNIEGRLIMTNTREAVAFDAGELLELEMILVDEDQQAALEFLKRAVWRKIQKARHGRLKCHLDYNTEDTAEAFYQDNRPEDV
jgi:hypothetical protein